MDERADVPVHLIGPPELVEKAAAWGWTPGLIPEDTVPVIPMDEMRDLFIRTFSSAAGDDS
jgi:hypothetical protein